MLYELKKPSTKKLLALLRSSPSSDAERECFDHLKRFVRSLDEKLMGVFLQFTTGSNIITVESIEVTFNLQDGLLRRPVAHNCGPVLSIPSTYTSYNELSEEFSHIFGQVASWAFNIV